MNVEEAEKVFGKRWNEWDEDEQEEFVEALDGNDPAYPLYLNLCCAHPVAIPKAYEEKYFPPGTKDKLWLAWLQRAITKPPKKTKAWKKLMKTEDHPVYGSYNMEAEKDYFSGLDN